MRDARIALLKPLVRPPASTIILATSLNDKKQRA